MSGRRSPRLPALPGGKNEYCNRGAAHDSHDRRGLCTMHARLANRLMMTAEEREAEWLAIEAKAMENPMYYKLKDQLHAKKQVTALDKRLLLAEGNTDGGRSGPPSIAENAEEEEEAERVASEAAEKAAEEAAAALIAEEEAEKAAARAKKKSGRKGKHKQAKAAPASPPAPEPPRAEAAAPLAPTATAALPPTPSTKRPSTLDASQQPVEASQQPVVEALPMARVLPPPPPHTDRRPSLVGGTSLERRGQAERPIDHVAEERVALVAAALSVRAWASNPALHPRLQAARVLICALPCACHRLCQSAIQLCYRACRVVPSRGLGPPLHRAPCPHARPSPT